MSQVISKFTTREARVIARMVCGDSAFLALRKAGFSLWQSQHPSWYISAEMRDEVERQKTILVAATIEQGRITAEEIHDILTDALRARMDDIRNDDHSFKDRSEWPDIWNWLEEGGYVEVEYEAVRSHDGEDKEGKGGWDTGAKMVRKVKFNFSSRAKLLEMAMKHKAVNAMVQGSSPKEIADEVVDIIQQRLIEARQKAAEHKRLKE